MSLLPAALRAQVPPLYHTEDQPDPLAHVKFFTPWAGWTWYVTEFDGDDVCFGLVVGHDVELGYFRVSELEAIRGPGGLRVECDLWFQPTPLSQVRAAVAA